LTNLAAFRPLVTSQAAYPYQAALRLLGVTARLLTDSSALQGAVSAAYGAPAFQPTPARRPACSLRALTSCPGWSLVLSWDGRATFARWNPGLARYDQYRIEWASGQQGPAGYFATRDLAAAQARPEATLDLFAVVVERRLLALTLARRPHHYLVHAGVLAGRRGAILLVGGSTQGKTTLSLSLAQTGLRFLSDDYAALDARRRLVHPFPTALRLRQASLALLPGLALPRLAWNADANGDLRACVPPHQVVQVADAPAPVGSVFLLQEFASRPRGEPLGPSQALVEALRAANLPLREPGQALCDLAPTFAAARCYRLWPGPPADTAALVRALAGEDDG